MESAATVGNSYKHHRKTCLSLYHCIFFLFCFLIFLRRRQKRMRKFLVASRMAQSHQPIISFIYSFSSFPFCWLNQRRHPSELFLNLNGAQGKAFRNIKIWLHRRDAVFIQELMDVDYIFQFLFFPFWDVNNVTVFLQKNPLKPSDLTVGQNSWLSFLGWLCWLIYQAEVRTQPLI